MSLNPIQRPTVQGRPSQIGHFVAKSCLDALLQRMQNLSRSANRSTAREGLGIVCQKHLSVGTSGAQVLASNCSNGGEVLNNFNELLAVAIYPLFTWNLGGNSEAHFRISNRDDAFNGLVVSIRSSNSGYNHQPWTQGNPQRLLACLSLIPGFNTA